jgi:hypothetical protein
MIDPGGITGSPTIGPYFGTKRRALVVIRAIALLRASEGQVWRSRGDWAGAARIRYFQLPDQEPMHA